MTKSIEFMKKLIDSAISKGYFKNKEEIDEASNHLKNLKTAVCKLECLKLMINETECPLNKFKSCQVKCPLKNINTCPVQCCAKKNLIIK